MNRLTVFILVLTIMLFGCEIRFSSSEPGVPSETLASPVTNEISGISASTATGGGNIISDGGSAVTSRGVVWSVNPVPTTSLTTKTVDGSGTGSFPSSIKGLSSNTKYYVRAYAVNSSGTAYGNEVSFTTSGTTGTTQGVPCPGASTVKDIDGNTYSTVQIGAQCWMQSNLKVSKYRNGAAIPTGLSDAVWESTTSSAYAIYANNINNDALYGKLYNLYAVNDVRGLCPTGWHVPTKDEWDKFVSHLGGVEVAGGKMKSTTGWRVPNNEATNESGFTGLPGGSRVSSGKFDYLGSVGVWWSSSEINISDAWALNVGSNDGDVSRFTSDKEYGFSVRCLRD